MMSLSDLSWLAAPSAALLLACLLLVPLGTEVLRRGVVFIDLAVAQVAACGVLAAGMLFEGSQAGAAAAAATLASLLGAGVVWWLARRWPEQREALIGLVYVAGSAASVLAVASDPHGRERLTALLAADVLWVPWNAVGLLGLVALLVAGMAALRRGLLQRDGVFYPVFAVALAAAVQTLGLYLVFAFLIGPALWVRKGLGLPAAVLAGVLASMGGMAVSWALDWPSGACVAVGLCATGLLSACFRRERPDATSC